MLGEAIGGEKPQVSGGRTPPPLASPLMRAVRMAVQVCVLPVLDAREHPMVKIFELAFPQSTPLLSPELELASSHYRRSIPSPVKGKNKTLGKLNPLIH
jgi:hypothetical protein